MFTFLLINFFGGGKWDHLSFFLRVADNLSQRCLPVASPLPLQITWSLTPAQERLTLIPLSQWRGLPASCLTLQATNYAACPLNPTSHPNPPFYDTPLMWGHIGPVHLSSSKSIRAEAFVTPQGSPSLTHWLWEVCAYSHQALTQEAPDGS